jgi:hypothetical protein
MKITIIFGFLVSSIVSIATAQTFEPYLVRAMCIAEVTRSSSFCMNFGNSNDLMVKARTALCVSFSYDRIERTKHEESCQIISDIYDYVGSDLKPIIGDYKRLCNARLLIHKKSYYTAKRNCNAMQDADMKILCEAMVLSKALAYKENRITPYVLNQNGEFDLSVQDKPSIMCRQHISSDNFRMRQACQGIIGHHYYRVRTEMMVEDIANSNYMENERIEIENKILDTIRYEASLARCGI